MNGAPPLEQLRGLHIPADPHWWPLVPAWWLAALLLISLMVGASILMVRWYRARRWRVLARAEYRLIAAIELNSAQQCAKVVRTCSKLLRRISLACYPRHEVAGLTGMRWLQHLDAMSGSNEFSGGVGQLLITVPYKNQMPNKETVGELLALTWRTLQRASSSTDNASQQGIDHD